MFIEKLKNYSLYLVFLIPASFLIGTFFVNLLSSLIILYFLININNFNISKYIFPLFKKWEILIFFIFFLVIIVSSLINDTNISKSLFYFRFFLLLLAINFIFEKHYIKIDDNIFNRILIISTIIVILSLFLEFIFYKFGILWPNSEPFYLGKRFSGIFFSEYIAGWYLSLIGLLTFVFIYRVKSYYFVNFFFIIVSISIFCVGSRSALLSFVIFFFIGLFLKEIKYFMLKYLIFFCLILIILINLDMFPKRYSSEIIDLIQDQKIFLQGENLKEFEGETFDLESGYLKKLKNTQWGAHYLTAIEMFKSKKIFGYGIKSFREECKKEKYSKIDSINSNIRCSTHPHTVILELLSETGIISTFLFYFGNLILLYKIIFCNNKDHKYVLFLIFVIAFSLIIPFKPSGSIFTSNYAHGYWFLISIIIFHNKDYKKL